MQNGPTAAGADFIDTLLARGLDSGLARRIAKDFSDWETLGAALQPALFSEAEIAAIRRARERREIPRATVRRLVMECEFRCCICWSLDADSGVVIHHIRPHQQVPDDSYENLIVLCPDHHSKVHSTWELAKHPYPPDLLRQRKEAFISAIAEFRAGRRAAPGREGAARIRGIAPAPAPSTHFTGRQGLLKEVAARLNSGRHRAVLVGMGGVGKTAVALKLIEQQRGDFPGGVFWFETVGGEGMTQHLLRSLLIFLGAEPAGLNSDEQVALVHSLLAARSKSAGATMLVIDNATETALETLVPILSATPSGVAVLLTSRESAVAASLDAALVQVDAMDRDESRRLLESVSNGALTAEERDIERLLALLGCLPLAIELIGRQIALRAPKPGFSIAGLCAQLEQFNAALLSFPGHRGIAVSFALSYDAMEAPAQNVFRCLGIFADGPLTLVSVAAVGTLPAVEVEGLLDRMVMLSMLKWGGKPGDYRIHPLLHKFAAFQLEHAAANDQTACRERFVSHFLGSVEQATRKGEHGAAEIDPIIGNVTKAVREAAGLKWHQKVSDAVLGLAVGTGYFGSRNLESESIPLLELAANAAAYLNDPDRVAAHTANLGNALHHIGRIREAIQKYKKAISIVRKSGNDYDLASNLQNLGSTMLSAGGDPTRTEGILHEAFAAATRAQNSDALIASLSALGGLCRQVGRRLEARNFYLQALEAARLFKHRLAEGNNLSNAGLVTDDMGDVIEGERMIREALDIAREIGDRRGEGNRLGHLGGMMIRRAQKLPHGPERFCLIESAREHVSAALRLAQETSDQEKIACCLMNLGNTYRQTKDNARALALFTEALTVATDSGFAHVESQVRYNIGTVLAEGGQLEAALVELQQAGALLATLGSPLAAHANRRAAQVETALAVQRCSAKGRG